MKFLAVLVLSLVAVCPTVRSAEPAASAPTAGKAKPVDAAAAQKYLQVTEWTAKGGVRYTLADAELLVETPLPNVSDGVDPFASGKSHRVSVEAAAAKDAWEKIEKLSISKWRAVYDASDLGQEDSGGTDWMVDVRMGKEKKQSRGANAFPGLNPIGMMQIGGGGSGPDAGSAYSELVAVLRSLATQ